MLLNQKLKIPVSVTFSVVITLISLGLILKIPKPLLTFISFTFLFFSALFWFIKRNTQYIAPKHFLQLLLIWISSTTLFLGIVYNVDRAGWNWFKLTGYNVILSEHYADLIDWSPAEFVERFHFFSLDPQDSSKVVLSKGEYEINETIVFPKELSLVIEPGTILRFGAGCSLISYSPIIARGTELEPIIFTARNKLLKWGVVGIVRTGESEFTHVKFEHARRALVNNIEFFAGLTLIETDVTITNSQFMNMFGRDAVNIRNGNVLIKNNTFQNAYQDGVDLDNSSGEISYNEFINCADEGIDLRENINVRVFDNTIIDAKGGRISADNNLLEIKKLNKFGRLQNP